MLLNRRGLVDPRQLRRQREGRLLLLRRLARLTDPASTAAVDREAVLAATDEATGDAAASKGVEASSCESPLVAAMPECKA